MLAERLGEWAAARRAWQTLAEQAGGDERAGFLVAASVAADLEGDASAREQLLVAAEALCPNHPRVALQRLDQSSLGPERLRALEGLASDDPPVAALLAVHRAAAYMLLPNIEEAEREVAEAARLLPGSLTVDATAVNVVIHRGRIAASEHRAVDYLGLFEAHEEALRIRQAFSDQRRHEESLRMVMLAADALTVVKEPQRARAVIRSATQDELAMPDSAEVLGDAALRALGWQEALNLTANAPITDGVRRIQASAELEQGGLFEQNRALATLDELVAGRGREALQAALHRLAATFGRRRADWSDDAFYGSPNGSVGSMHGRGVRVAGRRR